LIRNLSTIELPSVLYQIRYLLRASFDNQPDKKLVNIDTDDVGVHLQQSARCLIENGNIEVEISLIRSVLINILFCFCYSE